MRAELEERFDNAMMEIYQRALQECGYSAKRYLQMLHQHRGIQTARILLNNSGVSDGYIILWEMKRLDLTVEFLVLQPKWARLFSETELAIARKRLAAYGQKN